MEDKAIEILDQHRTMAIATLRPDGWPQTTFVGYANEGLLLYFIVSRTSQKYANISADERVSIAVGSEPEEISALTAVYAGAQASEVTDAMQRSRAWRLMLKRQPWLAELPAPDFGRAAMMRAHCHFVTIVDFRKGIGHSDALTSTAPGLYEMESRRDDDWGYLPAAPTKEFS